MKLKSFVFVFILFIFSSVFFVNGVTHRREPAIIVEGWINPSSINYIAETNKRVVTENDYLQTHGGQNIIPVYAGDCIYIVNADNVTDRLFVIYFGDNNFCESEVSK